MSGGVRHARPPRRVRSVLRRTDARGRHLPCVSVTHPRPSPLWCVCVASLTGCRLGVCRVEQPLVATAQPGRRSHPRARRARTTPAPARSTSPLVWTACRGRFARGRQTQTPPALASKWRLCSPCVPCFGGSRAACFALLATSPGFYCTGRATKPTQFKVPAGHFSLEGASIPQPCPPGTYQTATGQAGCLPCESGYFCPNQTTTVLTPCTRGHYCLAGSVAPEPCPAGSFSNNIGNTNVTQCEPCPPGSFCGVPGLTAPGDLCAAGYICQGAATDAFGRTAESPVPVPCTTGGLLLCAGDCLSCCGWGVAYWLCFGQGTTAKTARSSRSRALSARSTRMSTATSLLIASRAPQAITVRLKGCRRPQTFAHVRYSVELTSVRSVWRRSSALRVVSCRVVSCRVVSCLSCSWVLLRQRVSVRQPAVCGQRQLTRRHLRALLRLVS